MSGKVVVYDFDKTLTKRDTLLGFFAYAAPKNIRFYVGIIVYVFCMVLAKLRMISNRNLKSYGIRLFLKYLKPEDLKSNFQSYNKEILFNHVFDGLIYNSDTDYYIVTASFQDYVKPIFPNFVNVIGSTIKYSNGQAIDIESNCYQENKVERLKQYKINVIDTLYTDSFSDLALARIAKKIIIVNKGKLITCEGVDSFIKFFKNK